MLTRVSHFRIRSTITIAVTLVLATALICCALPVAAQKPPPPPPPDEGGKPPPPLPPADAGAKPEPPPSPTTAPPKPTAPPTPLSTRVGPSGSEPTATPAVLPSATATRVPPTALPPTATPSPTGTSTVTATPALMPLVVSGGVFEDQDGDGKRDPSEPGVSGVPVMLDGRVVGVTDAGGRFSLDLSGERRALLSIVAPEGWRWVGQPMVVAEPWGIGDVSIPLQREATETSVTGTGGILAASAILALGMGWIGFTNLVGAATRRSVGQMERRMLSQQLELQQHNLILQRQRELKELLVASDGHLAARRVMEQLITDAGLDGRTSQDESWRVERTPCPHIVVSGARRGREYLLSPSPGELRRRGLIGRRDQVVPLDAGLSPYARIEAQALWDHAAQQRGLEGVTLPRNAAWFLVVRERPDWILSASRRRWWQLWRGRQ